jgi:hypothetical protein
MARVSFFGMGWGDTKRQDEMIGKNSFNNKMNFLFLVYTKAKMTVRSSRR